ncbi:hypothetical protein B0T21DRAFT_346797 [Apiosordaria backusii]|uniref:Protein kinase domain-containing protein n=1 Tax=Apiosordaria backusii TaxID=314023 RepID=A0AA40EGT3_9PEZI|nr:hypothetical protein B0T21DRAFT_346797 [Apiosordaria backusii]
MASTYDQNSPYQKGAVLELRAHVPPLPFGLCYSAYPREEHERVELWSHEDRIAFAIANPPFDDVSDPNPELHTFTIVEDKTQRRLGVDPPGAHIVVGQFDLDLSSDNLDQPPLLLAKIYDGVDYMVLPESGPTEDYTDIDGMIRADSDYSIEAGAYEIMTPHEALSGKLIPRFYGCWTFPLDVPVSEGHPEGQPEQRWVRMILMEFIEGESMEAKINRAKASDSHKLDYELLPAEPKRLYVLKQLIEAEVLLWWEVGLKHEDLEPRNVMIKEDDSIVIIDFCQVRMTTFLNKTAGKTPKERADNPNKLPRSPIETYWPFSPSGSYFLLEDAAGGYWGSWIPQLWHREYNNGRDDGMEMAAAWLLETWSNDERYAPVSSAFLNHTEHEMRNPKIIKMLEALGRTPARPEHA